MANFKNERPEDFRRIKVSIFLLAVFIGGLASCYAQTQTLKSKTYYISLSGNDQGKGTIDHPWKSIQKVNTVQLGGGDSILFKGEQIFKGTLQLQVDKNGLSAPILIASYGNGKAVIDAKDSSAILVEKTKLIHIQNLKLVGSGRKAGNSGDGIAVKNCSQVEIKNVEVSGFQNAGLNMYASSNIKITGVNAHDNGFAGISISGEYPDKKTCNDIYVGYCQANNNPGSPVILNNHSGNGIVAGYCSRVMIEYCSATNNGWDMPRTGNGPVGIWCYEADSVVIQHCISYRNKTSVGGDDGGGFDLDGGVTNSIIQYCLTYENQGSGFGIFQYAGASNWYNNTVRYNISANDGTVSAARAGIYIWNSSGDEAQFYNCSFYNNTIYNKKGTAINFAGESKRKGFVFYNNIFVGGDSLLKGQRTNDVFLANNWWSIKNKFYVEGVKNLAEWAKKSGQEMRNEQLAGLNADPGFQQPDDLAMTSVKALKTYQKFAIEKKSPLRQNGIDLKTVLGIDAGTIDFNGNPTSSKGIGASF